MANAAVFQCIIDFGAGSTFDPALVLDDPTTPLDSAVLGTAAADTLDVSQYVLRCQIRRAYNRTSDSFLTGTAYVRLIDSAGIFNPANTSSPYYGKILPNRKIRFLAKDTNNVTYALGSMYVNSWKYTSPTGFDPAFVDLQCQDGFGILNLTTVTTVTGGTAGQTTAQRVTSILDQADWPTGMRSISSTATTTCQADDGSNRSALQAIQTASDLTDLGAFYMNQNGFATFLSRADLITLQAQTRTVFSDTGAVGTLPYLSVSFDLSTFGLINVCNVTRTGGTMQQATDSASRLAYGDSSRNRAIIAQTDTEALNQALMIIASRKDSAADLRMESMTLDLSSSATPALVTAGLSLDMFDPIQVVQTFPTGSITSNTVITGVGYDIDPNSFKTIFTCAQPFAVGLVLDSASEGILDVNTLAY